MHKARKLDYAEGWHINYVQAMVSDFIEHYCPIPKMLEGQGCTEFDKKFDREVHLERLRGGIEGDFDA